MPRIRSIKPDAFTSDSLSSVSILARWTFAGLWTYCDDEGRGRADARLIKAALFPIDDTTALSDVLGALNELEGVGAICRYRVDDKTYLHVPKWDEHQKINRATPSKLPSCPACAGGPSEPSVKAQVPLTEESVSPHQRKGTGKGKEQGSEHAHERVGPPDRFDEFWSAYPRKDDKAKAAKAWAKALKKHSPDTLIEAARQYRATKQNTERQFILLPTTWLNGERWEDEQAAATLAVVSDPSQLPPPEPSWMRART